MKVAIINDCDIEGGAARAAFRLCKGLRASNVDASMWVQHKTSENFWVNGPEGLQQKIFARVLPHLDILPLSFYKDRQKKYWSLNWFSNLGLNYAGIQNSNIVHLHWIGRGFVPLSALSKFRSPLLWTLHDTWAFTGGCHYHAGCNSFVDSCGRCPQLGSKSQADLSRGTWNKKNKAWRNIPFLVVTPSKWLAEEAKRSSLFRDRRIEVIPNGLDLTSFKPIDKKLARQILSLPDSGNLVLFGAANATSDQNKGYFHLVSAINKLAVDSKCNISSLLIFGASEPKQLPNLQFPVRFFGRLHDDMALTLLYSAADVMVVPSVQEAFGQTATEAMACGTPVVAFGATGLLDIVDHMENGYLAKAYDPYDLALGIEWVLENGDRRARLSENARNKCQERFNIVDISKHYIELYSELLSVD